jgi:hypothetical protein
MIYLSLLIYKGFKYLRAKYIKTRSHVSHVS